MKLRMKFRAEDLHHAFPVNCVKIILCFTVFHLSEAATGGVLLENLLLEVLQNSQKKTCGKVSFSIKLQAEATASDLPRVFS